MLHQLQQIAIQAGNAILDIYHSNDFNIEAKGDGSPLTKADKAANDIIVTRLQEQFPEIPILSEEGRNIPYSERKNWQRFFLVDPLDGTKEFIKRNGEFTVNIALIENGHPIAGVVYAPVINTLYASEKQTNDNWLLEIKTANDQPQEENTTETNLNITENTPKPFRIVASRSHNNEQTQEFIAKMEEKHKSVEIVSMGSSLKLCLVAEGKADVYPRLGPTMEWDTAAAHAIALAANCSVLEYNTQQPLTYNKENLLNPHFIVTRNPEREN
jgi:3'(2'), 5'-bisphosphate nucleotidase